MNTVKYHVDQEKSFPFSQSNTFYDPITSKLKIYPLLKSVWNWATGTISYLITDICEIHQLVFITENWKMPGKIWWSRERLLFQN